MSRLSSKRSLPLKVRQRRFASGSTERRIRNLCEFASCLNSLGQLYAEQVNQIEFDMLFDPALCAPEVVAKLVWIQEARKFIECASGTKGLIH